MGGAVSASAADLHAAVEAGNTRLLVQLVRKQVLHVDTPDDQGRSPLVHAAAIGAAACVEVLLTLGADPLSVDDSGLHALHYACESGSVRAARVLSQVAGGALVRRPSPTGLYPLELAVHQNHSGVVHALLEAGADIEHRDDDGDTPLMAAGVFGYAEVVRVLLQFGAPLHHTDREGRTALQKATLANNTDCALLVLHDARLTAETLINRDDRGNTVLHAACARGNVPVLRSIIRCAQRLFMGDVEMIALFVNQQNTSKRTPIYTAADSGSVEAITVLLEYGADTYTVDATNHTVLQHCDRLLYHERRSARHQQALRVIHQLITTFQVHNPQQAQAAAAISAQQGDIDALSLSRSSSVAEMARPTSGGASLVPPLKIPARIANSRTRGMRRPPSRVRSASRQSQRSASSRGRRRSRSVSPVRSLSRQSRASLQSAESEALMRGDSVIAAIEGRVLPPIPGSASRSAPRPWSRGARGRSRTASDLNASALSSSILGARSGRPPSSRSLSRRRKLPDGGAGAGSPALHASGSSGSGGGGAGGLGSGGTTPAAGATPLARPPSVLSTSLTPRSVLSPRMRTPRSAASSAAGTPRTWGMPALPPPMASARSVTSANQSPILTPWKY